MSKAITVFYDGKCGLCSKEINHYKKIAPDGLFVWQDITSSADGLNKHGITLAEGLKFLHTVSHDGQVHVGLDSFILIWRQLSRWRILAEFVSLPLIRQTAELCYCLFASWRFRRIEHCKLALKNEDAS